MLQIHLNHSLHLIVAEGTSADALPIENGSVDARWRGTVQVQGDFCPGLFVDLMDFDDVPGWIVEEDLVPLVHEGAAEVRELDALLG